MSHELIERSNQATARRAGVGASLEDRLEDFQWLIICATDDELCVLADIAFRNELDEELSEEARDVAGRLAALCRAWAQSYKRMNARRQAATEKKTAAATLAARK